MQFPAPLKEAQLGYRRPGVVVPLSEQNEEGGVQLITHYSKPNHPPLKSAGKLVMMTLDWLIGYWRALAPKLANGHPIIFDRHYLIDLAVDPNRYRYGGPIWLVRLAQKITPKPNLVLFLDVTEEVSQARKQEPGADNFNEQRQAYLSMARQSPNWCVIDATQPLERVLSEVEAALSSVLPKNL